MPRACPPIRALAAGLVVTAVLLTAACGRQTAAAPPLTADPTSSAAATPVSPTSVPPQAPSSSGPPNQEKLDAGAAVIDRLSVSYPDSYTGLVIDNPGDRVIVYRKPDPAFDAALARLRTGVRVALRDAPRSDRELVAVKKRVELLLGHTTGYRILTVGGGSLLSYTEGVVEVGVSGDLARAKRELAARFGDRVRVSPTQPAVG